MRCDCKAKLSLGNGEQEKETGSFDDIKDEIRPESLDCLPAQTFTSERNLASPFNHHILVCVKAINLRTGCKNGYI